MHACWTGEFRPKKTTVVLSPEYIRMFHLGEAAQMALAFASSGPLLERLVALSCPCERPGLASLYSQRPVCQRGQEW